jgi:hypothetical protein
MNVLRPSNTPYSHCYCRGSYRDYKKNCHLARRKEITTYKRSGPVRRRRAQRFRCSIMPRSRSSAARATFEALARPRFKNYKLKRRGKSLFSSSTSCTRNKDYPTRPFSYNPHIFPHKSDISRLQYGRGNNWNVNIPPIHKLSARIMRSDMACCRS